MLTRDEGAGATHVKLTLPEASSALPVRLTAGMALAQGKDRMRALKLLKPILAIHPRNADARAAAKRVGYSPK